MAKSKEVAVTGLYCGSSAPLGGTGEGAVESFGTPGCGQGVLDLFDLIYLRQGSGGEVFGAGAI